MTPLQDVFISYGRADSKHFAAKLHQHLIAQEREVWFDFEDIPLGVDYQKQIDDGIEKADNFVFVIAPHSVNSPYCGLEVELALKRKKRIIPILHVEEISRKTWQQRNPNGSDEDWETYKAAGKHSSFPNLHPAIGKINWVYCREGIDDFDAAFAGLLEICGRHQDYVHQHTVLLSQALAWEANQRQAQYLLDQENRQRAETWLCSRCLEEQPPCEPTSLHCEFITESIKQANGGMTDVFLSYAEEDKSFTEALRQILMRAGLTVWTNYTDLTTGEDFAAAINQGIENTDSVIYVMSPCSAQSIYCQQELDYALRFNKRILSLLFQPTDWDMLPERLQGLQYIQYIDCSDWIQNEADWTPDPADVSQLFNILKQDAPYYHRHKLTLTKALKWERQDRNASLLLRGNSLRQFEAWLKLSEGRSNHGALPIQLEFLEESRAQPTDVAIEVFIAYDEADMDFAQKLNDALQDQGKSTWFDRESVDSGEDLRTEINTGIEQADNVIFVLSPDAVNSPSALAALEYAQGVGKRLIPVSVEPVEPATLPTAIAALKPIDFQNHRADFYEYYSELVRTLDSDRDHVRGHTKWLNRAMEWQEQDQPKDMLLRGNELAVAETWMQAALEQKKQPRPTALQKDFVKASHGEVAATEQAEKERQAKMLRLQQERAKEAEARLAAEQRGAKIRQLFLGAVSVGFAIACGLSIATWVQYQRSLRNELEATAKSSAALFASQHRLSAVLEAVRANRKLAQMRNSDPGIALLVDEVLQQSIYGVQATNHLLGHDDWVVAVSYSPDGELLATGSKDGTVKLWRATGELLHTFEASQGAVWGVAFSPDSQRLIAGGADGKVNIWNVDGTLRRTFNAHEGTVAGVAYSPDGKTIASVGIDPTLRLWNPEGKLLKTLRGHEDYVVAVAFDAESQLIAAAGFDGRVTLWKALGEKVAVLEGHEGPVWNVAFDPQGEMLASVGADGTIRLWSLAGDPLQTLTGHRDDVEGITFSADGEFIVSGGADYTVRLWQRDGTPVSILRGHNDWVWSVSISPEGRIASGSGDNRVILWQINDLFKTLEGHPTEVWDATFSPDGNLVVTGVGDGSVWLWHKNGTLLRVIDAHNAGVEKVAFSDDGTILASASWDRTIKFWDLEGNLLQTLEGHEGWVLGLKFSSDGELLASSGEDGTVRLWNMAGEAVAVIGEGSPYGPADGVTFSQDGQYVAAGYEDHIVRIWDLEGNLVQELVGHEGAVYAVSFSSADGTIATAGADKTIRLWNQAGELLKTLDGHEDRIWRVSFSPDGTRFASAGDDRSVRLWTRDGVLLKTLRAHQKAVEGIRFSPDGKTLLSSSWDTTAILWDLEEALKIDPLTYGCEWIQDFLAHSAEVKESDRDLCKDVL